MKGKEREMENRFSCLFFPSSFRVCSADPEKSHFILIICSYALLLFLQGRFEILCLSGSYLVLDDGGTRTRSGGLCIALCGPDHRVIGGSVGGVLTAAGTVQVIASFCVMDHLIFCGVLS